MAADTEYCILASFAMWAGDFSRAKEFLVGLEDVQNFLSNMRHRPRFRFTPESPESYIYAAGAMRIRQMEKRHDRFLRKLRVARRLNPNLHTEPLFIASPKELLRASIWQFGRREFRLMAYPTDLKWGDELFVRTAAIRSSAVISRKLPPTLEKHADIPIERERENMTWGEPVRIELTGDMLVEAEVSEMALITARGTWTKKELAMDKTEIVQPFQSLLNLLEAGKETEAS
jgi:hypothetical protein